MFVLTRSARRHVRRGAIAVLVAVSMTGLLFMAAIAIDGGNMQSQRRQAQNAADAAALAACIELTTEVANNKVTQDGDTTTKSNLRKAALSVAQDNGFIDDTGSTCDIAVNWPPSQGSWTNTKTGSFHNAVEVVITLTYTNMTIGGSNRFSVRAVATYDTSANSQNAIVLTDPSGAKSLWDNYGTLHYDGVGSIQVNSTSSSAVYIEGNGTVDAPLHAVGGSGGGNGSTYTQSVKTGYSPAADPYALLPTPSIPSNTVSGGPNFATGGNVTLNPGYYPNGLRFGSGNLTLTSGLYYIGSGHLWINTAGSVNVDTTTSPYGVTFYYTNPGAANTTANSYNMGVKFCISDNNYNLKAPTTGTYAGVSLFQDPNTSLDVWLDAWGVGQLNFGAMYLPGATMRLWSQNNYGGQTNPININANQLVAKDFKVIGSHDWYGTQYNGGWSNYHWHSTLSAPAVSMQVVLVE